ncbi:MAG: DUF2804 family protein [Acutalibacteraceae bacterium]
MEGKGYGVLLQSEDQLHAGKRQAVDGKEYVFHPETDFGTLDWGRGVWTYDNRWYWGSAMGCKWQTLRL